MQEISSFEMKGKLVLYTNEIEHPVGIIFYYIGDMPQKNLKE